MPNYIIIIYSVIILCNTALAVLVFLRNRKSMLNIIFTTFSIAISGWIFTLYLLYSAPESQLLLIGKLNFIFAELIAFFGFWLGYYFPIKTFTIKPIIKHSLTVITVLLIIVTLFTDLIDKQEIRHIDGGLTTVYGNYYIIFCLYFIVLVLVSTFMTSYKYFHLEDEMFKLHIKYYIIGSLISIYFGILSNIILPALMNGYASAQIGPLFSIIFIASISYAILKHRLMNIKSVSVTFSLFIIIIISFISFSNSSKPNEFILNGISLIATIIVSIYVLKNLHKEINRRKVTEKLAKYLEKSNDELHRLDKQKSEFMSITSHQLRTPLTATKGYVSLILEGDYGEVPEKISQALTKVYSSNERLIELVEDLLNISRIESGRMKYNFQEIAINKIIDSLYDTFILRANEKNLDFTINTGEKDVIVYADPLKIKEVISNLIDNAIKYTEKGFVSVNLETKSNTVYIYVKDSGIGFSEEVAKKLFSKFSRGEKATNLHMEGTGLGLFVGKKIAEAHDGEIEAMSDGNDKGSTFILKLPILKTRAVYIF